MPSGIGRPLKLRLFLEGQEVPVISCAVSINTNAPAAASIQVLPLDAGMDLKPRTMVHVFFKDHQPYGKELDDAVAQGLPDQDVDLLSYNLLFSGEVVGFAFGQTPMARSLVLQCLDFSSYWEAAHATAVEWGPNGNAFHNGSSLYGSNASLFDDIVNFQPEVLVSWLRQKPLTPGLQSVSGLAGGVIRMLEAIGGVPTHHKGVNDFFTVAELRTRLLAQLTAEENDSTASKILSASVFQQWLSNGLQNIGQQVSFRDMLKLLCSYIYYEVVPNPIAKYDRSYEGKTEKTVSSTTNLKSPIVAKVASDLSSYITTLTNTLTETADNQGNIATGIGSALQASVAELKPLGTALVAARTNLETASSSLTNLGKSLNSGSVPASTITSTLKSAITTISDVHNSLTKTEFKISVSHGVRSTSTTARLRTQILRPDCFFAPAPRCNVIFPEHFTQISFDRSYLSEVTRSLTQVYQSLVGRDQLFSQKILAPNIGLDMAALQKQVGGAGTRILLPHERHTGIIPRTEWLADHANIGSKSSDPKKVRGARLEWAQKAALFHFFKYRLGPRTLSVAGRFNPSVVCGFPAVVILKPFQPRADDIRKVLNKGSQSTVSDQDALDAIKSGSELLGAPYQFVGMVGSVQHNIDQGNGTTSIAMHHARKHLGVDDEFVGVFSESDTKTTKTVKVPLDYSSVAASSDVATLKLLVDVTPQDASATSSAKFLTSKKSATSFTTTSFNQSTQQFESVSNSRSIDQTTESTESSEDDAVQTGKIQGVEDEVLLPKPSGKVTRGSKGKFGKILGVQVITPGRIEITSGPFKGKKAYSSVILYEEVKNVPVTDSVPIEEIIRPSWFSPKYQNSQIGKEIYEPFFGTGSIIDELGFTQEDAETLFTVDSTDGTFDPTKKLQEVKKALADKHNLQSRLSIEKAVNLIAYIYGMVKTKGKDVDDFVRTYTGRPIATIIDILGSSDFSAEYDAKGGISSVNGVVGFHSLAVDREGITRGQLSGLMEDPTTKLPRINQQGKESSISPVYDVRDEKLQRVDAYIEAITKGPGLQG